MKTDGSILNSVKDGFLSWSFGNSKRRFSHQLSVVKRDIRCANETDAFGNYHDLLIRYKSEKDLFHGKLLHACIIQSESDGHKPYANLLLQLYAACGARYDAEALFASIQIRDVVSWNAILALRAQTRHGKQTLGVLQDMACNDVKPNRASLLISLSTCDSYEFLDDGLCLHSYIVENSMESDVVAGTALVSMYGRCHRLEDALDTANGICKKDIVAWNAIITAHAQNGLVDQGIQVFFDLIMDGLQPNKVTFLTILDICSTRPQITEGRRLHVCVVNSGFHSDISVENALINMYSKCGSIMDAWKILDRMQDKNVISWTSMISTLVQDGFEREALQSLFQMQLEGVLPNNVTFVNILTACSNIQSLKNGMNVHALLGCELKMDNVLCNALINMYGKHGCIELARSVFACTHCRDVISWNCFIASDIYYSVKHFIQMQMECFIPIRTTFLSVLMSCSVCAPAISTIKHLHTQIINGGHGVDMAVLTTLICTYGKCGFVEEMLEMVGCISMHDMAMGNAVIGALAQNGCVLDALKFFHQFQTEGLAPDNNTLISILDACGYPTTLEGKKLHVIVIGIGLETDISVNNALLRMYGKCNMIEEGRKLFENLIPKDIFTWNSFILALGHCKEVYDACQMLEVMQMEGLTPDKVTFATVISVCANAEALEEGIKIHARIIGTGNKMMLHDNTIQTALVNLYGKCGSTEGAKHAFSMISNPDVSSWNVLIASYIQCGQPKEALCCYQSMQHWNVNPDKATLTSILSAFASDAALTDGRHLHTWIMDIHLDSDISIGNALINMYGKSGSVEDAEHVFKVMEIHDIVTVNAMVSAYAQHGQAYAAIELLWHANLHPDKVTLISILMACSHAGLVTEGYWFFQSIIETYEIERDIDHYNCMIDLLGRAGRLHELDLLMKYMPIDPTYKSWMTLLGSCKLHFDLDKGEVAANNLLRIQPGESAAFILLSHIYALAGRWDDVSNIRNAMRTRN